VAAAIDNDAFKKFESTSYSEVAKGYADKTAHVSAQSNDAILDASRITSGSVVLDVACGPGLLSAAAVQRGASVIGVDFAPNIVTIARSRCPAAEFRDADAENLPFGRCTLRCSSLLAGHSTLPKSRTRCR
jgi:ubiquinone/menaquinone biosynthesis C-methylase UbiE